MSAFIVAPHTIDATVNLIWKLRGTTPLIFGPVVLTSAEDLPALARALYALNVLAVQSRYGDPTDTAPSDYEFTFDATFSNSIAQVKQLQCLRYQCSEDGAVDHPLFIALDALADRLMSRGVADTSEYQAAAWG